MGKGLAGLKLGNGMVYNGTIDLNNRPVVHNADGSISTERSLGFSPDGRTEILIPQVIGGKIVSPKQAVHHFFQTGEELGVADNTDPKFSYEDWEKYANAIHNRQDKFYNRGKK